MSGRELDFIHEAFNTNYIAPSGSMLPAFEKAVCEYTEFPYAVAVASGTAALHLAVRCLRLDPGGEIWASTLTFIGGISAIVHDGFTPVFFDADEASWNMDPALLAEEMKAAAKRGRLPKLVLPTEIYGQACDLDAIQNVCAEYDVPVITDSAESLGARYKGRHAGNGALAAALSFNGNKIVTTSGGGMLLSSDRCIVDRARYLATQAREPVTHYEHVEVGFNYRLSNISAAIGCGQMEHIEARVNRRRAIFERYYERLSNIPGISFMPEAPNCRSTRWLTALRFAPADFGVSRSAVQDALEAENVESRPVWKPMHCQPVFKGARSVGGKTSERIFTEGLCLPSGSAMTDADVDRVSEIVACQFRA
jgi:dTDP-4-amino-4,6-dideoxygalactose transaminase